MNLNIIMKLHVLYKNCKYISLNYQTFFVIKFIFFNSNKLIGIIFLNSDNDYLF